MNTSPPASPAPGKGNGHGTGILAITATAVLWGTTGTVATFAPNAGPLAIGSAALGVGGILQALIALPALRRDRARLMAHWPLVLLGALAVVGYPLAFYSSMHLAGVAIGTAVSLASAPLFSGLIEVVLDRRWPGRRWGIAAVFGVVGTALTSFAKDASATSGSMVWGIALGLGAGLTYAIYSWVVGRLLSSGVTRGAAMGSVFGLGGVGLMPILLATGAPLVASTESILVAAYMALIPMFLGYVLFGIGLARVPASTATTVTLLEPAVAAVLAVLVVGERLGSIGWFGLGCLACALLVLTLRRR